MAVAFSNLTEIIDTDQNNSITVTPPSGLAAGDIWLIVVVIDGSAGLTIDTPAGFSNIGSQIVGADDGWPQVKAFYKTAGASESNATVTSTGTDFDSVAYSVRITGTGTLSLDATGTPITPTGTGTTIDAPDITIAENNSLAVLIAASVGTPTFGADQIAAPSGATLRDYRDGNDVYPACGIATQAVNAGSFAPGNWGWGASATNNNNRIAQTFSFKESGGSASAAISGTATASIGEADIVTGGKTVVVTLTGDTFVANTGFPVVEGVAESSVNTAGTSHAVTLPASIAASDLVLILMDIGSTAATLNALTDWEELLDENSANGLKILRYTGSGVPGNPTFTSSASTRSASIAYRISNADKSIAPQIGTTATGSSTTPNPPSVTPTGGVSKDYLFIAFYGAAGEEADDDTWSDTPPTNYTPSPPRQKACGTVGTNLGGLIAAAERQLTTGSAESPGTFAKDVSASWRAQTIIVHPKLAFDEARAAMRDGLDSAQSEAGGWDAKVKPNIPLANIVRTSGTVCTITLQAQADYDITAQETIEVTVPASILTGASPIVGTPTFTIDATGGGGGGERRQAPRVVSQAVNRSYTY